MRYVLFLIGLTLIGCFETGTTLAIAEAEAAGFEMDQQQVYHMVDAIDGWSGNWAGDRVELYEYETVRQAEDAWPMFENIAWNDKCRVANMILISTGNNACEALEDLVGGE